MEKEEWARIQLNWSKLGKDTVWVNLADKLREAGLFDLEDVQRVNKESVDVDQVERMLLILKHKPASCRPFPTFCDVLASDDKDLANLLQSTAIPPNYFSERELSIKEAARRCFLQHFVEREEGSVSINEVRRKLEVELRKEGHMFDWEDGALCTFVKEVSFKDVHISRAKKSNLRFHGLVLKDSLQTNSQETHTAATTPSPPAVEQMTVAELQEHLKPVLQKLGIPDSVLGTLTEQDIDGCVFLMLDDAKMEKLLPSLSHGKRWRLLYEIDAMRRRDAAAASSVPQGADDSSPSDSTRSYRESFRKFDCPVDAALRYMQGRQFPVDSGDAGGLLAPARKFVLLGQKTEGGNRSEEMESELAREALPFAAALLNERRNGTIYFGVSPTQADRLQAGEVVGMTIDKVKCCKALHSLIQQTLPADLVDAAMSTIRDPQFVEVVSQKEARKTRYVVEVDVVPRHRFVKDNAFVLRAEGLGRKKKKGGRSLLLYRLQGNNPTVLSDEEELRYMEKTKKTLSEEREQAEKTLVPKRNTVDLQQKIRNLFAGGNRTVDDEIYPVLMLSPLDDTMNDSFIRENFSFFPHIDAHCVFDFEPKSYEQGICKLMEDEDQSPEILTTDNFDQSDLNNSFIESLHESEQKKWIFCNGYSSGSLEPMSAPEWYEKRSEGFREALRYFSARIPRKRGLVVFFLFSKNYEVMLEVAHEVLVKPQFRNQWMAVAETEAIAEMWIDRLSKGGVKKKELKERCVVGMPWEQVKDTFMDMLRPQIKTACELPTTTGGPCVLRRRVINELSDLEVLGMNACSEAEVSPRRRRKVEEQFLRGEEAQWWNFSFGDDHVLKRVQHKVIMAAVEKALEEGEEGEDKVGVVVLQHQPGAGGTTSAKQVLWDLREKYRCCVVRKITDQTCDQICRLRRHGERKNARPCLVLLDNQNEDDVQKLYMQLDNKARGGWEDEEPAKVFCVLLKCVRCANLPLQANARTTQLRHELDPEKELTWFRKKNEALMKKYEEDKLVDPKFLLSFNILKENFNQDYIRRTVGEIIKEIHEPNELTLLKYLSLLNLYDTSFQPVPLNCFDPLMSPRNELACHGLVSRSKGWEAFMSASLRILLNRSSRRHGRPAVHCLRLINPLLARQILDIMFKEDQQSVSSIMKELLNSVCCLGSSAEELLKLIQCVVKRRIAEIGGPKQAFSPFVTEVQEKEGADRAAEVLELTFEKTGDAFVAQQIARFFMITKNWTKAEFYAREACRMKPENSYFMDSLGRVFKLQIDEKNIEGKRVQNFSDEELVQIIQLGKQCLKYFRQEQSVSRTELQGNMCGYFSELRAVRELLQTFVHFKSFKNKKDLKRFLVDSNYVPASVQFLSDEDKTFLKSLHADSLNAIQILEDYYTQLKNQSMGNILGADDDDDQKSLVRLKADLNIVFWEDSDDVPPRSNQQDACEFRRRRAISLGATSLGSMGDIQEPQDLLRIRMLMEDNIKTESCSAFDLMTYLGAIFMLNRKERPDNVNVDDLVKLSIRLYRKRDEDSANKLECYLYFVLLNFPTPARQSLGVYQTSHLQIQEAMKFWKEAFHKKYPHFGKEELPHRNDVNLFFLGNGEGLDEIVYYKSLSGFEKTKIRRDDRIWISPKALLTLRRFKGLVKVGGKEIELPLETAGGNRYNITIQTSKNVARHLHQKTVYFVLGMSWTGPRAFHVTREDPTLDGDISPRLHPSFGLVTEREYDAPLLPQAQQPAPTLPAPAQPAPPPAQLDSMHRELEKIDHDLQHLEAKRNPNQKDKRKRRDLLSRKEALLQSLGQPAKGQARP